MRISIHAPCLALAVSLGSVPLASAQGTFLGNWEHPSANQIDVFVAPPPLGNPGNSGLTPSSPLDDLQTAVNLAEFFAAVMPTGTGTTVNVLPGTYAIAQPISVPAFGISIEPYWGGFAGTPPVLQEAFGGAFLNAGLLDIDRFVGPMGLAVGKSTADYPATSIRGLRISSDGVTSCIRIEPDRNPAGAALDIPLAVEVRQCDLGGSPVARDLVGIDVFESGAVDVLSACVFAENEIHDLIGVGIRINTNGDNIALIKGNRIHRAHDGIFVNELGIKESESWPRILSNFVYDTFDGHCVRLINCSATVVNNSIGFAVPAVPIAPAASISWAGNGAVPETLIVANNILFSPDTAGLPPTVELLVPTPFPGTLVVDSNSFDATDPLPLPGTANIAIASPLWVGMTTPFDLHLTDASLAVVGTGNGLFTLPGATITVRGTAFPADINLDVDVESRVHQDLAGVTRLDRGGDQHVADGTGIRYADTVAMGFPLEWSADPIGNLIPDAQGLSQVEIDVVAPPGSFFFLFLSADLPAGPDMQHAFVTPFGSGALNPASLATVGSGTIPGSSVSTVHVNFGSLTVTALEAETYLQALVFHPNGTAHFTNRLRIDLDIN